MFSPVGKEGYEGRKVEYGNLLDIVQAAGLGVRWLDNQSGCKGVCDRVPNVATSALKVPEFCTSGECLDEVMLHELPQQLAALDPAKRAKGTVVVMHQMGSHGPAYYKRSPAELKQFKPECSSHALQNCPPEQIVNAYDNSTDFTTYITDFTDVRLKQDGMAFAIVFAPAGENPGLPPSAASLPELGAADGGTTGQTSTTIAGATTVPGATTIAGASTVPGVTTVPSTATTSTVVDTSEPTTTAG